MKAKSRNKRWQDRVSNIERERKKKRRKKEERRKKKKEVNRGKES